MTDKIKIGEHEIKVQKIPYKSKISTDIKEMLITVGETYINFYLDDVGNLNVDVNSRDDAYIQDDVLPLTIEISNREI